MPAGLDVYTADVAEITTEGSVRSCLHQSAAVKDDCGGCDAPQQPRLPPLGVQSAVVKSSAAHSSNAAVSAQSAILRINPSGSIACVHMKPTQSIACGGEYLRQSSRARQGKASAVCAVAMRTISWRFTVNRSDHNGNQSQIKRFEHKSEPCKRT
jgi:hypothetical protein